MLCVLVDLLYMFFIMRVYGIVEYSLTFDSRSSSDNNISVELSL